jgi:predicted O-methyltransferase YrrM
MSEVPFDADAALEYSTELYKKRDKPTVEEYADATGLDDFEPVIEDEIARMFRVLLRLTKPKHILEIGMSIGFSTTTLAKVAKEYGGNVLSIEVNDEIIPVAEEAFKREGVADVVKVVHGDAKEILANMKDASYDLVFQDSSKRLYPVMLDDMIRVLKKGGLLLVDDTLFPVMHEGEWDESDEAIHRFNKAIAAGELESTILPIGEGLTVGVKL